MNDAYRSFLRYHLMDDKVHLPLGDNLESALSVTQGTPFLIKGVPEVGKGSLCLAIADKIKNEVPSIFLDGDGTLLNRLSSTDSLVLDIREYTLEMISSTVDLANKNLGPVLLVINRIDNLIKVWKDEGSNISQIMPFLLEKNYVLLTAHKHSKIGSNLININFMNNVYYPDENGINQLRGHLINISSVKGSTTAYIDHSSGLYSTRYEYAIEQITNGSKSMNSTFDLNGTPIKGFWNYVHY